MIPGPTRPDHLTRSRWFDDGYRWDERCDRPEIRRGVGRRSRGTAPGSVHAGRLFQLDRQDLRTRFFLFCCDLVRLVFSLKGQLQVSLGACLRSGSLVGACHLRLLCRTDSSLCLSPGKSVGTLDDRARRNRGVPPRRRLRLPQLAGGTLGPHQQSSALLGKLFDLQADRRHAD